GSAAPPPRRGGRRPVTPAASSWLAPPQRYTHHDLRPLSPPGPDRQTRLDQTRALAHALQAQPCLAPRRDLEPAAPVPHAKEQLLLVREEPDGGPSGLRVADDVPQRLLGHAVDAEGHAAGEVRRDVFGAVIDLDPVPLFQTQALRTQGVNEAQIVQD